jgi:hypothetical protein
MGANLSYFSQCNNKLRRKDSLVVIFQDDDGCVGQRGRSFLVCICIRSLDGCQSFLIVPLFILMVVCSWVFSMVFVIGSMTLADTCVDSPDGIILQVVENVRNDISAIIADFLLYYISGKCE